MLNDILSLSLSLVEVFHVYLDKQTALKVIQNYKKGRLKIFKNHSDAVAYVRTGYEQLSSNSSVLPTIVGTQEKFSNFKAPEIQELQAFKWLIENGDLECVKKTVWKNPRYLISSADTPAILRASIFYNYFVLHNQIYNFTLKLYIIICIVNLKYFLIGNNSVMF